MANRFWVGDTGNWSDALNHWSATDGGAPNASKPTNADSVFFTANSFSIAGRVVTVDEIGSCLDMDWTGATDTPALGGASGLNIRGSLTFIAAMTAPMSGGGYTLSATSPKTITTAGVTLNTAISIGGVGGTWTLQDDLNLGTNALTQLRGTLITGGFTLTVGSFNQSGATARTVTLSSSVVNCTAWNITTASLTLTANTSTIKVTGTGVFTGAGITTYNNVELNGTAHTISGDNTFNVLTLPAGTTQTITLTAGSIQTAATMTLDGDATHTHTILSSTAGTLASLVASAATYTYCVFTDIRRSWETLIVHEVLVYNKTLTVGEGAHLRSKTKFRYT